jgi:hypothetical protein
MAKSRKSKKNKSGLALCGMLTRWLQFMVAVVVLGVIYSGIAYVVTRGNEGRVEGFVCLGAGFLMLSGVWWWFSKRPG